MKRRRSSMIAIACDHGGYALKEAVKAHLTEKGYEVKDFGHPFFRLISSPIQVTSVVPSSS